MSGDLKFDKMNEDTKLAQQYLDSQNAEFYSDDFERSGFILDVRGNKIYRSVLTEPRPSNIKLDTASDHWKNLLSNKLEENIGLICELDYMIRNRPFRVTKLDLQMIIKNLCNHVCVPERLSPNVDTIPMTIIMKEDSSLMDLGCIAQMLPVTIMATKDCAVVCHLFKKLCQESGITSVSLAFIDENEAVEGNIIKDKALEGGCIGVVTAKCDVDSAVEAFLTAPTYDPWGFRRLLVQESASDRFKKSIAWKAKLKTDSVDWKSFGLDLVDSNIESLSSDVYIYDSKVFVREYVGVRYSKRFILIEEYRTVKELMSLIESYCPFCVSLWSSDVAESHEICYGITSPFVWVNDYGVIGMPLRVSEAYYSRISSSKNEKIRNSTSSDPQFQALSKVQKDWVKLSPEVRRNVVLGALRSMSIESYYEGLVHKVYEDCNHFVYVDANSLVVGLDVPSDIFTILFYKNDVEFMEKSVTNLFRNLILFGNGVIIYVSDAVKYDDFSKFITCLKNSKVPVQTIEENIDLLAISDRRKTRIIHKSFGTIFAN